MLLKDYDLTKAEQFKENMIKEHENKIKEIDDVIDQLKKHSPAETLAVKLHDTFCPHDHINGCAWLWEVKKGVHDWTKFPNGRSWPSEHARWLILAERMLNEISFDSAYNFCQIYKNRMAYKVNV